MLNMNLDGMVSSGLYVDLVTPLNLPIFCMLTIVTMSTKLCDLPLNVCKFDELIEYSSTYMIVYWEYNGLYAKLVQSTHLKQKFFIISIIWKNWYNRKC